MPKLQPVNMSMFANLFTTKQPVQALYFYRKLKVEDDQEIAQPERNSHSKNRSGKQTNLTIRYLYKKKK